MIKLQMQHYYGDERGGDEERGPGRRRGRIEEVKNDMRHRDILVH